VAKQQLQQAVWTTIGELEKLEHLEIITGTSSAPSRN